MVKLKKRQLEMPVFKLRKIESARRDIPVKVAVLDTIVCFDFKGNPTYNCTLEKANCLLEMPTTDTVKVSHIYEQSMILRFPGPESKAMFCEAMRSQPGKVPPTSPKSTTTASPKSSSSEPHDSTSISSDSDKMCTY